MVNLSLKDILKNKERNSPPPISLFKLFKYSKWKGKILIGIGIAGSIVTGLAVPYQTKIFGDLADDIIDAFSVKDSQPFFDSIKQFVIENSIIGVVVLICSYISITTFNYAAHSQIFTIRKLFFRSALNQDIEWYDFHQSGEFGSRMNEDLSKIEEGLGEKVVMFAHYIIACIGSLILALAKGWLLALISLLSFVPVIVILMTILSIITSRLSTREANEYAKAGAIAEQTFSGIRTVVAFGGEQKEINHYKSNLITARQINEKKGFISAVFNGLFYFFTYASYSLTLWYGIGLVLDQKYLPFYEITYTVGAMLTIFFSVMTAALHLAAASPFIESLGAAKGAGAKVFQLIENVPVVNALQGRGKSPKKFTGDLEFRDVHFQYPSRSDVKVLQGLNLKINRGETVALVGSSGCGKSTCIQLLQRFYDPHAGNIFLDGNDIKDLNVNWLRSHIGTVGQEPVLFGTTIYENIRYGRENATREEIENAAKESNAHNFIKKLPQGYNTLVGERGAQLSGGQKQRIAIARSLIRNPEILLLDEATSALDTASEAKVQKSLEKASMGRTTIIIAHRLTTIRNADKIFVIDKGQVVEIGNHNELMEIKGHYFNLITSQASEHLDDGKIKAHSITAVSTTTPSQVSEDLDDGKIKTQSIFTAPTVTSVDSDDEIPLKYEDDEVEETEKQNKDKKVSFFKIMKLNKPEWPYILIGCIGAIFMGCAVPIFSILFGEIFQVLSKRDDFVIRNETNTFCLYFIFSGTLLAVATFFQIFFFTIAGEILTERLRGMAFSAMIKQEIGWFDEKSNGTGTLCARLSNDAAAVQGATGQRIGILLQSVSTLILSVFMAFYYEFKLGLLALVFTPFLVVTTFFSTRLLIKENVGTSQAMEECTKLALEVISSIRTVVSLGLEKMFYRKYVTLLKPAFTKSKKMTHLRGLLYGSARSLIYFAYAACSYYGGHLIVNESLEYGKVFKVIQSLIMGSVTAAMALAFSPNLQKGLIAAGHVVAFLNRKPEIGDPPGFVKEATTEIEGNVEYSHVKFRYPTSKHYAVFSDLNLEVSKGQTVALVGPSGCGKSTCLQLLQRFYDVEGGTVSIDQRDITTMSLKYVRRQLGSVSQEPTLFDRTVSENIAYGDNKREVNEAEIIEAARKANIHNFISSLPLGYDTRLGEKGTLLSGGQKQRIAIARALIRNPRILLLDEATSALDAESEKIVQAALESAREGRTCITIAHRLSTIIDSDVIFVLDGGEVVEKGTHAELLRNRGLYYSLFKLQSDQT